jgi:hypothetical protein
MSAAASSPVEGRLLWPRLCRSVFQQHWQVLRVRPLLMNNTIISEAALVGRLFLCFGGSRQF